MDRLVNIRFKDVLYTNEQLEMFAYIVKLDDRTRATLSVIGKHTRTKTNQDAIGITQTALLEEVDKLNNSRTSTQKSVAKLVGMGVIYYEQVVNAKLYSLNQRGVQLLKALQ